MIKSLIRDKRLEIHFMPIVSLSVGNGGTSWRTHAFEALVRGPEGHALRSPYALFNAAEAHGVREELDLLCVEASLSHRESLPDGAHLFLNVDPRTFQSDRFLSVLESHGSRCRDNSQTVVEITEHTNPEGRAFRRRLETLEDWGFSVALDDITEDTFSLRRLIQAGPVAYWKLDRSVLEHWMTQGKRVQDWLPWLSKTASELGTQVVIEGIEDRHLKLIPDLHEMGLGLAQGFLFGKPAILAPGLDSWRQGFQQMIALHTKEIDTRTFVPLRLSKGMSAAMAPRDLGAQIGLYG